MADGGGVWGSYVAGGRDRWRVFGVEGTGDSGWFFGSWGGGGFGPNGLKLLFDFYGLYF